MSSYTEYTSIPLHYSKQYDSVMFLRDTCMNRPLSMMSFFSGAFFGGWSLVQFGLDVPAVQTCLWTRFYWHYENGFLFYKGHFESSGGEKIYWQHYFIKVEWLDYTNRLSRKRLYKIATCSCRITLYSSYFIFAFQ